MIREYVKNYVVPDEVKRTINKENLKATLKHIEENPDLWCQENLFRQKVTGFLFWKKIVVQACFLGRASLLSGCSNPVLATNKAREWLGLDSSINSWRFVDMLFDGSNSLEELQHLVNKACEE